MNKTFGFTLKALAGVAGAALIAGSATAADLAAPEPAVIAEVPSVIDVAFGVAGVTDYTFRGLSQSQSDPAIQGYAELQAYGFYAGVWASSVQFNQPFQTDPSAEVDFYASAIAPPSARSPSTSAACTTGTRASATTPPASPTSASWTTGSSTPSRP
ncbi:TorF family putative porin [Chenggangzhangella methanolivorans]|uniref:TorF family putative porin n=1 Tax=Chenggangzhangella methanolivorans TaxID=1437009 RepID=UPI0021BD82E2|nr:TorF family putative porin [Chenggangzhangella methanolivorans]